MSQLTILSDREVDSVHQASLRILGEVGIRIAQKEAREILTASGARVAGDRVLLPPDLVEQSLARCPQQVTIRSRSGKAMTLGDGTLHWHNVGGASDVYETQIDQRRPATVQDVRDSTRVLDALDGATNITPFFTPQDVPGPLMSLSMYRHALPYTTKALQGPGVQIAAEVDYVVRMASILGPPPEFTSLSVSPISPLFFPNDIAAATIAIARHRIPFAPLPCPTAGATAPLSLAGALAQQNAEVLACVVLAQTVQPGLPTIYCGRLALLEPRTGVSVWGGVELGLLSAATVQIGHHYGLPVNVYGLSTNANTMDLQNGYERALNAALPAMAGADELSGIGEMAAGVQGSYAQMVLDDEITAGVQRIRRGFVVDDDSLAVDVIQNVMDGSANFLDQRHTVRYLRSGELLLTKLASRQSWPEWEQAGRQDMVVRAQAQVDRILAEHEVPPLSEAQEQELDEIMQQAQAELVPG